MKRFDGGGILWGKGMKCGVKCAMIGSGMVGERDIKFEVRNMCGGNADEQMEGINCR